MAKRIDFFDGAESSTVPTIGNIVASDLVQYTDDADFEANEQGSPQAGNIYYNTTDNVIRYYNGTQWISIVDEQTSQVVQNKTIDGTDATGTNQVSIDATDAAYDNFSSGLVATDAQGAIDEVEGRVDTNETNITTNATDIDDLETLSGSPGVTDHGTFSGTTISDGNTTKGALQELETSVETKLDASEKGAPNGIAELDGSGLVPASQLPSFVDDVLEASDFASLPATGESGKIYVTLDDNKTYRWTGSVYIEVSASDVTSVNGQTGTVVLTTDEVSEGTNEYYTDAKVDSRIAASSIDALSDVDTSTVPPAVDDALVWDGANWVPGTGGGSGTGIGGITYIFADFEEDVSALVPYQDAVDQRPVDGIGGSPNVTVTAETVSPLIGAQSAKIAKDAADRQGEGVAILSSTVDEAYSDKVHTVEFLWKTDANYASGDMALFVVHPTTGTVEALNFRTALGEYTNELPASSSTVTRIVSELTPIDPTYRIVLHVASTSATAYEVFVDNIQCGPQRTFNAPIVTEWESYTPTFTGFGTPTNVNYRWRRVGSTLEIEGSHTNGTLTATEARISFPGGLQSASNVGTLEYAGEFIDDIAGLTTDFRRRVMLKEASVGYFTVGRALDGTAPLAKANANTISGNSADVSINAKVEIDGWDAGAAFSTTQVDQQTEALRYTVTSAQTIETAGSGEVVNFNNQVFDELNSVTTGASWSYTAPTRRKVKVNTKVFLNDTSWGVGETAVLYIRKNGTNYALVGYYESEATQTVQVVVGGSASISLDAGETVDVFLDITRSGNCTIPGSGQQSWVEIEQIPDFSVFGTFPEKNLVQTKILSSNVTSNGTISDLTFNNLTIGKWYEVTGQAHLQVNSGAQDFEARIQHIHNGNQIADTAFQIVNTNVGSDFFRGIIAAYKFQATATSLTFVGTSLSSNSLIVGNGSRVFTYIQLEERNDLRETSKF